MNSGDYICSGTVVTDNRNNYSIVLTAGHCAYDASDGGFARNWMFIPEFDSAPSYTCSAAKYGCWTAGALVIDSGFATSGSFNTQATHSTCRSRTWTSAARSSRSAIRLPASTTAPT